MKKIKILLVALLITLLSMSLSTVYAAQRTLGAQEARPFTNLIYKYRAGANGNDKVYTVVKIYDNSDRDAQNALLFSKAIYCLRGGVGFGSDDETDVSKDPIEYTEFGEMHVDAKSVIEKYLEYYNVNLDKTETINSKQVNVYNAILWILDESYLPVDKTNYDASDYKAELLDKVGIHSSQQGEITDDDLEVIQQLAIWYFANYDEQIGGDLQSVSQATKFPAQFLSMNDNNNIDSTREENLNKIYQYFVYGAIDNADIYQINTETGTRTKYTEKNEFDKTLELKIEKKDISGSGRPGTVIVSPESYYQIGPFSIKSDINERTGEATIDLTDIILYDANDRPVERIFEIEQKNQQTGETESGGYHNIYTFVDSEGQEVTKLQKGINYYIRVKQPFTTTWTESSIPGFEENEKYDLSEVTLKLSSVYSLATATFLVRENADQPLVEIDKEKIAESDEITTKLPKKFDLSLRKFITYINGEELTGEDSRVPSINTNTLISGLTNRTGETEYTATYTHPKNPLQVATGDKVIYTIRVYNEGELDGTATQVTDYLPDGLELVPASESAINTTYKWSASTDNKKIIATDYLKDITIKAFDETLTEETAGEGWQKATTGVSGLYYVDLQVECKVIAEASGQDQFLRNIAAITEDTGDDIDSIPGDPGRDDYNPPVDNSAYKEDDDDYEDLILPGKSFDLSLRKFISKVERINKETNQTEEIKISSREPVIEIKALKDGTAKTARYIHPKNKISLKRGDIIYYTIRVYNEGELDGYAKEVKDYLPEGLELVEGQNDIWTVNGNVLSTDALKDQVLLGYNKDVTSVQEGVKWQKASDDQTGLYYYDLTVVCKIKEEVIDGQTLVNIAEISVDEALPTDTDDRDSEPKNFPDDNKNNNYEGNGEEQGYYPGKQDDDDFERVTVEPNEVFDLALRKYIVEVNDVVLSGEASRVPNIETAPLKQSETTADYKHKKYPVEVEVGDTVTYRFTVYNEGELDGYVYSIIDYLPQGLTFDNVSNTKFIEYKDNYEEEDLEGKEYIYKIEGNKITITPVNKEELFELKAFDGTILDNKSVDVKFKVTANNSNEDQVLTNVATMTYAAKGTEQKDRDSNITGEEFNVPTEEKLLEDLPGYKGNDSNKDDLNDSTYHYEGQQDDDDFEKIIIKGKPFDLALRKFITSVKRNGAEVEFDDRTPKIDLSTLINGTFDRNGQKEYTATYEHSKEPLVVKKGDIVTYTLRIYNEGERDGYATEITDYIPEGLALILNYNTNFDNGWKLQEDFDYDEQLMNLVGEEGLYETEEDVKNLKLEDFEDIESLKDVQLATGKVKITSSMLQDELIKAFDETIVDVAQTAEGAEWQKAEKGEGGLYYKDIQVSCLVIAENTCKDVLTNIAEISEDKDENKQEVIDRDSTPDNVVEKNEDDDDYEPVVLRYFDLALRKFITGIETNGEIQDVTSRIPALEIDKDGNIVYEHSKDPVYVANNDTVIYTIRVYNEGTIAGYAEEITDDIPEGLEYLPEHSVNQQYEWVMIDEDGNVTENVEEAVKIITDYLSEEKEIKSKMTITDEATGETITPTNARDNLIDPFDSSKAISDKEPLNPDYRDVKVAFRVIEPDTSDRIIINSAQISEDSDDDEDSEPGKWNEGEDDQDREYIYVKYFDLSLLKWVTQTIVTVDGKTTTTETGFEPNTGKTESTGIRDNEEAEPIAKVEIDRRKLKKTTVKFVYNIKVTNEGEIAGYATEITDYIPEGLEFLEEDNKAFGWEKSGSNKVTTRALETVLLQPGESATVKIVFTWKNNANNLGLKTNIAEISEDYNVHDSKDIDSEPDNKLKPYEEEQEDDDDFALVILSITTGKGASYIILILSMLTLLASGMYLIKKYVLTY